MLPLPSYAAMVSASVSAIANSTSGPVSTPSSVDTTVSTRPTVVAEACRPLATDNTAAAAAAAAVADCTEVKHHPQYLQTTTATAAASSPASPSAASAADRCASTSTTSTAGPQQQQLRSPRRDALSAQNAVDSNSTPSTSSSTSSSSLGQLLDMDSSSSSSPSTGSSPSPSTALTPAVRVSPRTTSAKECRVCQLHRSASNPLFRAAKPATAAAAAPAAGSPTNNAHTSAAAATTAMAAAHRRATIPCSASQHTGLARATTATATTVVVPAVSSSSSSSNGRGHTRRDSNSGNGHRLRCVEPNGTHRTCPVSTSRYPTSAQSASLLVPAMSTVTHDTVLRFLICDAPTDANLDYYLKGMVGAGVSHVVRCCQPTYNPSRLQRAGITVLNLPFIDGEAPPAQIIATWLQLVDDVLVKPAQQCVNRVQQQRRELSTQAQLQAALLSSLSSLPVLAAHCVTGLGRAPLLVAIALIECGLTPTDAIASVRKQRRGALNTRQAAFLTDTYRPTARFTDTVAKLQRQIDGILQANPDQQLHSADDVAGTACVIM